MPTVTNDTATTTKKPYSPEPLFDLGQTVATPGLLDALEGRHGARAGVTMAHLLYRHSHGDYGDLNPADWRANVYAVKHNDGRVFSAYNVPKTFTPLDREGYRGPTTEEYDRSGDSVRVWVITEADRSSTCILLPEEY